MAISRLSLLKFLELVITCACVALHCLSYNPELDVGVLVTGTFVGFLIILAGAVARYLMRMPYHYRIDVLYSVVGVVLFLASGALLVARFLHASRGQFRDLNLAKGALAIVNSAILLADAILTQRGG